MTIYFLIVPGKGLGQNNPRHLVDVMANGSRIISSHCDDNADPKITADLVPSPHNRNTVAFETSDVV